MNKILKNIVRIGFSILFVISMFGTINILANQTDFSVTNLEVKEISDKTTLNKANLTGNSTIDNDIIFASVGDYIKYNITIKNNTDEDKVIKSISDDNSSPYVEYIYDDLTDVKVAANEEKTFELQIKYIQKTTNLIISDQNINLTLTYEKYVDNTNVNINPDDNNTNTNTNGNNSSTNNNQDINNPNTNTPSNNTSTSVVNISNNISSNPKTYDGMIMYLILGAISLGGLILTSRTKTIKKLMIVALVAMTMIPFGIKADSDKYIISYKPNIIRNSYSKLVRGIDFNLAISKLSSGNENLEAEYRYERMMLVDKSYNENDPEYQYSNNEITSIKNATLEQYKIVKSTLTDKNIVSTDDSTVPTYVWFDNGTIYYYSHAEEIDMNEDSSSMFHKITNLTDIDFSKLNTYKVTNMSNMFRGDISLNSLALTTFDTRNVTDMRDMFNEAYLTSIDVSNFDTSKVIYFQGMFNTYQGEYINVSNFNTSNAIYINHMFAECNNLKTIDLSNFDTRNVESMAALFYHDYALESVNLSSFNTKKVMDLSYMFMSCGSLTSLDLSNFDTSNVKYMNLMFRAVNHLPTLDLSNFNTKNVENMADMFSLTNFTNLNISSFNTSNVTDMHGMFSGAGMTSVDVSSFDTKKVTTFWHMFSVMPNITELDLSYFDTRSATDMRNMFSGSTELKTIYVSENFVTTNVTESGEMFIGAYSIDGGNGTLYDENHITKEYAHFDGGPSNPGYFHQSTTYRVIFNSKGGSEVSLKIVNIGNAIGTLETPIKIGFTFEGWYLDNTKIESDYIPTSNITLTAKYQPISGFDANIYSVWIWAGSMAEIRATEATMDESIDMLNTLGIKEVYLAIDPDLLQNDHLYLEKLYDSGIKVYALYGDPVFIDESNYSDVIDYDMEKIAEYNANNLGTSHIEGIHYDIEYYGYRYDGVNTCKDGNSEEAMNCPARKKFVKFVQTAHTKAQELGLKTQYDITVYSTNYSFYYDDNGDMRNVLDEIIDYTDDIIIMAYGNSPKNTMPSFFFKGVYNYDGATNTIDRTYLEKIGEKNMPIYVGQELEVFKSTAQELQDDPSLGPIYLPEYEGEHGTEYKYTYNFVMTIFNDLETEFSTQGVNDIRIVVHDYSKLKDLYDGR